MEALEVLVHWGWYASVTEGLSVHFGISWIVPSHGGSTLIASFRSLLDSVILSIIFNSSTESPPERRNIISILRRICFWSSIHAGISMCGIRCPAWRLIPPRNLHIPLTTIRIKHISPNSSFWLLLLQQLINKGQQFLKRNPILFLYLKHRDEHIRHFFSKFLLYPLQFLE